MFFMEEHCSICKNTGVVKEKDGTIHVCWDCLKKGKLDVHSKDLPDSKIKL